MISRHKTVPRVYTGARPVSLKKRAVLSRICCHLAALIRRRKSLMLGAHILFLDNSGYSTAFNLGCQIPIAGQEWEASREWPVKVARGRAVHRVMAPGSLGSSICQIFLGAAGAVPQHGEASGPRSWDAVGNTQYTGTYLIEGHAVQCRVLSVWSAPNRALL